MDFKKLAQAYAELAAAHTLGHLDVANKTGAPASVDLQAGAEEWKRPESEYEHIVKPGRGLNPATGTSYPATIVKGKELASPAEADRNAAGFEAQDRISRAQDSPESSLANAVYKAIYLAGANKLYANQPAYSDGDFGGIAQNAGISKDKVKGMVGFSTLADLYSATHPDNTARVGFSTLNQGTPGLVASMPIDQNLVPVLSKSSKRK